MKLSELILNEEVGLFPDYEQPFLPSHYADFKRGFKQVVSNFTYGRSVSDDQGDVEYGYQDSDKGAFFKYAFDSFKFFYDPKESIKDKDGNAFKLNKKKVYDLMRLGGNVNLDKV
jgi:hypothetical protein